MTISLLDDELFSESGKRKGWSFLVRRDGGSLKISVTEPRGEGCSIENLNLKVHGLIYEKGVLKTEFKLGGKATLYTCGTITLVNEVPEKLGSDLIEVACEAINKFRAVERHV